MEAGDRRKDIKDLKDSNDSKDSKDHQEQPSLLSLLSLLLAALPLVGESAPVVRYSGLLSEAAPAYDSFPLC